MKWAMNHLPKSDDKNLPIMSLNEIEKAKAFHQSFPQYSETPLTRLDQMAHYLGLGSIFIKDESYRSASTPLKSSAVPTPWPSTSPKKQIAGLKTCLTRC